MGGRYRSSVKVPLQVMENVSDGDSSILWYCPGKTGWAPKRSVQVRIQYSFIKQNRSLGPHSRWLCQVERAERAHMASVRRMWKLSTNCLMEDFKE